MGSLKYAGILFRSGWREYFSVFQYINFCSSLPLVLHNFWYVCNAQLSVFLDCQGLNGQCQEITLASVIYRSGHSLPDGVVAVPVWVVVDLVRNFKASQAYGNNWSP